MYSGTHRGGQYNVRPAEQRKIAGDVGLRRIERRRMRAKLKVCSPPTPSAPAPSPRPFRGHSCCPMYACCPSPGCRCSRPGTRREACVVMLDSEPLAARLGQDERHED